MMPQPITAAITQSTIPRGKEAMRETRERVGGSGIKMMGSHHESRLPYDPSRLAPAGIEADGKKLPSSYVQGACLAK